MGITDAYNHHSFGIRYKHAEQSHKFVQDTLRSLHEMDHGAPTNIGDWHANYNSIELYGKYIISPKVRAMAFLPYAMNIFS